MYVCTVDNLWDDGVEVICCSICKTKISDYRYNWLNGAICCHSCYANHSVTQASRDFNILDRQSPEREPMVVLTRFENEVDAAAVRDLLYIHGVNSEIRGHTNTAIAPNGGEYAVSSMQLLVPQLAIHLCHELIREESLHSNGILPVTLLVKTDLSYLWMIFFVAVVFPLGLWIYPHSLSPLNFLLILTLMPLIGFIIGQMRATFVCTNHQCGEVNNKKAKYCKKCGREIKGVVKNREEILHFHENKKSDKTL